MTRRRDPSGGASLTGAALPANATSMLTSDQQQFASRLAADTGMDTGVISAWLLAEESGGAATSRQSAGNNDWLNIGYTDSGTYGSADSVWSDPVTAADATAGWLKGQNTIPGYGTASSGIQAILGTAGPAARDPDRRPAELRLGLQRLSRPDLAVPAGRRLTAKTRKVDKGQIGPIDLSVPTQRLDRLVSRRGAGVPRGGGCRGGGAQRPAGCRIVSKVAR